ncbi:hypothetical protein FEM48_Zijuj04G0032700 [Ziziphus jujuba var. spinosa]|uniref:RPW8 domain-containing protein n=1 Tax=Ziziphus jujuba var. spinosa TaxID=714518 RepID=A0A978VHI5_ZIZJJ|nr:hypothetical protein FEM48_Zijuj04G0032700 [Ziziphus jujuba var. spinosa]
MAEIFGAVGAVISVGKALGSLYDAVMEVKGNNAIFEPTRNKLEEKLVKLKPLIKEVNQLSKLLHQTDDQAADLESEIKEGEKLVRECSKVSSWNIYKKKGYAPKLQELDKTLKNLIRYCYTARESKEMLLWVRNMTAGNGVNAISMGCIPYHDDTASLYHVSAPGSRHDDQVQAQLPSITVGLAAPLIDLKKKLLNENGTSMVIVTAPGGCGKTLLAQTFCRDGHVREKFKSNIFFVTVSKTPPSLILVVQELYKYKMNMVPVLQNEADAAKRLKQFLKRLKPTPILMVLDDVWPGAESLIKMFVFKIRDYKILITSRYELPKFAPPYHLSPLNDEDAMTLFRHSACWEDGEPGIPDYIVKKRIPLAIKIVAGSLGRQPVEIWQKRLEECSDDSSSRPDSENELLASLISDLDYSKVLVKECFKDLASFPEDRMIPVAALVDMWTELYELEAHVLDIILDLTSKNLANLKITRKDVKEVDDYYGQHFLVQHDLLREIAMDNSSQEPIRQRKRLFINLSRNELPESLKEFTEQPVRARLVSISTDEMISSNWLDMQLPEAEVLVLNFRTKDYALPTFVVNMKKLKVLIATSSLNYAELSDFQLLGLLTNLKTIRLERISIPSLSETCEPLRNLQKISLYMCRFAEAFRDCSIQISDLLPELREMNVDFCEDLVKLPAGLCDIVHLKKLSITHCYKLSELPNKIGNLRNLQVLRLRSCTELEKLPDSIRYLSELITLDISDCIRIKDLPEDIGELKKLINLNMNHCSRLQYLPESFWQLEQSLDLVCDKEIKEVWENFYPDDQRNITMRSVKEDINLEWLPAFS